MTHLSPGSPDSTSHSLVVQLQQGSDEAWERMVRLYTPLLYHWCRRAELDSTDAADVIQEVLRTVSNGIERFQRAEGGSFRGWMYTIFRSRLIDHHRRQTHQPHAQGGSTAQARIANTPADESEFSSADAVAELYQRAMEIIHAEFSETAWQAFQKTVVEGWTSRDAAAELGMTPGAVRQAKYRILHRVREELGEE